MPLLVPLRPAVRNGHSAPSSASIVRQTLSAKKPVGSRIVRQTAIDRTLAGAFPEVHCVDVEALQAAEEAWHVLQFQTHGPSSLRIGGPQSARASAALPQISGMSSGARRQRGVALSAVYNKLGMSCLRESPGLALECLQRALLSSPKEDPSQVASMCNLGIYHLQMMAPAVAIRYLLRAVQSDHGATSELRGRVRLNLSVAYGMLKQHHEALECAQEANTVLETGMDQMLEEGASDGALHSMKVLRAIALHNACASHEFLGQALTARGEARKAHRLARQVLGPEDALVKRLQAVETSVDCKVQKSP